MPAYQPTSGSVPSLHRTGTPGQVVIKFDLEFNESYGLRNKRGRATPKELARAADPVGDQMALRVQKFLKDLLSRSHRYNIGSTDEAANNFYVGRYQGL